MVSGKDEATEEYKDSYASNMLRAASTATKVNQLISLAENETDSYLVICGSVNMLYGHGIPERIYEKHA